MQAAIRFLTYERRWLSQAWELAEVELASTADDAGKALVSAQMDRLSLELVEITDALEALSAIGAGTRRVRLARNG